MTPSGPMTKSYSYDRIIARIENLQLGERDYAKRILAWVSCSRVKLRTQEITQALMIGEDDTSLVAERKILKSIEKICGPIIEFDGDFVHYVHFTARE